MNTRKIKYWRKGTAKKDHGSPSPTLWLWRMPGVLGVFLSGNCPARCRGDGGTQGMGCDFDV